MPVTEENLRFPNTRIVAVTTLHRHLTAPHLRYLYASYLTSSGKGFRNFFDAESDKLGCAAARESLAWLDVDSAEHRTLMLYVVPSYGIFNCFVKSKDEREAAFQDVIRKSVEILLNKANLPRRWVAVVDADSFRPFGLVIVSRETFDPKTSKFYAVKRCFPKAFSERSEPGAASINFIEKTFALEFFEHAALSKDFENRIDDLVYVAHKYDFELPVSYYAFRYLDEDGCLIPERDKSFFF